MAKIRVKMLSIFLTLTILSTMVFGVSGSIAADGVKGKNTKDQKQPYKPGEIIVKFKPAASGLVKQDVRTKLGLKAGKKYKKSAIEVNLLEPGTSVEETVDELKKDPNVLYAQPNYLYSVQATTVTDMDFTKLWGLDNVGNVDMLNPFPTPDVDINAPEAWDFSMGSSDVIVAVIDTGVDINHPELDSNVWTNSAETPNDGIDNDENGYVDDLTGWDFYWNDNSVYDPLDGDDHGTHVAGTIAATANTNIGSNGIVGVAPNVKIMPLKFIGPEGSGTTEDAVAAIEYAAANGAKVANCSWAGEAPVEEDQALLDAITASNMVIVAAAGNDTSDNDDTPVSPAGLPSDNIISVAAVASHGGLANFSNYGATTVDLGAPGNAIYSLKPIFPSMGAAVQATGTVAGKTYRVVHLGFGLENIGDSSDQIDIMDQILTSIGTSHASPILLVDDDNSEADPENYNDYRPDFQSALTGYNVQSIVAAGNESNGPSAATMQGKTVIWFTGDAWGTEAIDTLTDTDLANLKTFLNGGGKLVLIGSYIAYYSETNTLFTQYLGEEISDNLGFSNDLYGVGSYTGSYSFTDFMEPRPRYILTPTGSPEVIFRYGAENPEWAFDYMNGTSMAAPHVAGAAALLISINPTLNPGQVNQILKDTVKPLALLTGKTVTEGMLDAAAAVLAAKIPGVPTGLSINPGDTTANLSWNAVSDADLAGYNIYRDGVKVNGAPVVGTTYDDSGLVNDTAYSYQVSAVDDYGFESSFTPAVTVTPYAAEVYPQFRVDGRTAAKDGAMVQLAGSTSADATLTSAALVQLDADEAPVGAPIDVTADVSLNAGSFSGSRLVANFDPAAKYVRLDIEVDILGTPYTGMSRLLPVDNAAPSVELSYNKGLVVGPGSLTITAIFDEDILTAPTIDIDQQSLFSDVDDAIMQPTGNSRTWVYNYTVGAQNGWEFVDGEVTVAVCGEDGAGNVNALTGNNTFTIDSQVPAAPVIANVDGKSSPAKSSDTSPVVVISNVSNGDTVKIYAGIQQIATATAPGASVSVTLTGFTQGAHFLGAKAVDAAGNVSVQSDIFSYTVDLTPPPAPVISTVDGKTSPANSTNDNPVVVVGNLTAGDTVAVYSGVTLLNSAVAAGSTAAVSLTGLAEGTHTLKARATDPCGNSSAYSTVFSYTVGSAGGGGPGGGTPSGGGPSGPSTSIVEKEISPQQSATVKLGERAILEVPGNAFTKAVVLILKEVTDTDAPEDGLKIVDSAIDITTKDGSQPVKGVTLKLYYDKEAVKDPRKLGVYYFNEAAAKWEYTGGKVDADSGTITVTLSHFSKYAVMESTKTFADVNTHWAKEAIELMAARNVVSGMKANYFLPEGKVTRAQFATMVVKALNLPAKATKANFIDVKVSDWYAGAVGAAVEAGIIQGYSDGTFRPTANVTREEVAVILTNARKISGVESTITDIEAAQLQNSFNDGATISPWARIAVLSAAKNGIIKGNGEGKFAPKNNSTRAEATVMIKQHLTTANLL